MELRERLALLADAEQQNTLVDLRHKRLSEKVDPQVPAVAINAEGTIEIITPAARRLLGYPVKAKMERCFFSLVNRRNVHGVMQDLASMIRSGKPQASWLLLLRTGKGTWKWFKAAAYNMLDEDEAAVIITLRDAADLVSTATLSRG